MQHNQALQLIAQPLRAFATTELGRYVLREISLEVFK